MIYDCFTFFNELDLLEIRLNILDKYVDRFVLVEATRTQKNKQKSLYFELNKNRYNNFKERIIHIIVDDYPENITKWTIENYQRNAILRGLKNCNDNDIILISDLDEIPRPKLIQKYYRENLITAFDLDVFTYFLNNYSYGHILTHGPKMLSYKNLQRILNNTDCGDMYKAVDKSININTTPTKIRLYEGDKQIHIRNAGWHFSYIGKDNCIEKAVAICEGPDKFTEEDYNSVVKQDKFCGIYKQIPVRLDSYFPEYIRKNRHNYKNIIIKTGLPIHLYKLKNFLRKVINFVRH